MYESHLRSSKEGNLTGCTISPGCLEVFDLDCLSDFGELCVEGATTESPFRLTLLVYINITLVAVIVHS